MQGPGFNPHLKLNTTTTTTTKMYQDHSYSSKEAALIGSLVFAEWMTLTTAAY
jgi:hypothetical protein